MADRDTSAQPKTLGLLRYVHLAYVAAGAFLFWFLDRLTVTIWTLLADSFNAIPEADTYGPLISAGSAVVAAATVWRLYRNENINRLTNEVVGELSKVSWPARKEISYSTVVVVITSIIAAIILGTFDTIWSTITDLIY
jgi:preprotein translocase subunit SecE